MTKTQPTNHSLSGKTAIVTGASRGIGSAIAVELARAGANLAIMSRSPDALEKTRKAVETESVSCFAEAFSVCDTGTLETFISRAAERVGVPSILINNAGVYATDPMCGHTLESWRSVIETNLTAAMWATRSVLPDMIKIGWGRVINISSISGKSGEAYGAAYSASKFGMIGMTQSVALEVARHGITVNAVCPGWVETDMAISQLTDEKWCELNELNPLDSIEIARLSVPQQRLIQPQEVAALVRFLCTDEARGITGQSINICGGLSIH